MLRESKLFQIYHYQILDGFVRIMKLAFWEATPSALTLKAKLTKASEIIADRHFSFADMKMNARKKFESCFVCSLVWVCLNYFPHRPFNTKGALERAKFAVETQYAVVGVLEDLNTTLAVFEKYIPRFFAGATEIYYNEIKNFNKINKNSFKPPVSEEVKNLVRQNFSREIEFYKFCKQRLQTQFLAANLLDRKW